MHLAVKEGWLDVRIASPVVRIGIMDLTDGAMVLNWFFKPVKRSCSRRYRRSF
jgi:hypothetical protein